MYGDRRQYFEKRAVRADVQNVPFVKNALRSELFLKDPKKSDKLDRFISAKLQAMKEDHPFPKPSREEVSQGKHELVTVVTGRRSEYSATLKKDFAPLHGICVGPSGSGKTTWLLNFARGIHINSLDPDTGETRTPFWFIDTENQAPGCLAVSPGCEDVLFIDISTDMFRYNRYFPPGVSDPLRYLTKVPLRDRENRYWREVTMHLARTSAIELHNRQKRFKERQLLEYIESKQFKPGTRHFLAKESIVNRMQDTADFMPIYDTLHSHDLQALRKMSVVWMLGDLSADHRRLFLSDIMLWLEESQRVSHNPTTDLLVVIDELADFVTLQSLARADLAEPFLLQTSRTLRKRSVFLLFGNQTIHTTPDTMLANIGSLWIAFRPTEDYSKRLLANHLSLDREQSDYMMEMPDRQCVCRIQGYPKTFLGRIPELDLPTATEEQVAERIEQTKAILNTLLTPESEPEPLSLSSQQPELATSLFASGELSKEHLDCIAFLHENQFLPMTTLSKNSPFSSYKFRKLCDELANIGPGLIHSHRISTGLRGGSISTIRLTDAGEHVVNQLGLRRSEPVGHGGPVHQFWQHAAYRWAVARGHPTKIEHWLRGKSVDVGVDWGDEKIAIEIALGPNLDKEIANLIKDLECGWHTVVFATLTDNELNKLKNEIVQRFESELLRTNKVKFVKLSTFLETQSTKTKTNQLF